MTTTAGADAIQAHFSDYLRRAGNGERILVEQDGAPLAAIVSLGDLQRLETPASAATAEVEERASQAATVDDLGAREAAFRRALQKAGVVRHWPEGPRELFSERELLPALDPPLSEQIIAERR